jgi:hypothetical protein
MLVVALTSTARAQPSADPASAAPPAASASEASPVHPPVVVAPSAAPAYTLAALTPGVPALVQVPDVEKPARVPLAKRWWFWTSIGGAAVAVVLIGLLVRPATPYSGNASPGLVQVF